MAVRRLRDSSIVRTERKWQVDLAGPDEIPLPPHLIGHPQGDMLFLLRTVCMFLDETLRQGAASDHSRHGQCTRRGMHVPEVSEVGTWG